MRIAFIVNSFPKLSETFVLDQIINCLKENYQVDIFPRFRLTEKTQHPVVKEFDILKLVHYPQKKPLGLLLMRLKVIYLICLHSKHIKIFENLFSHPDYLNLDPFSRMELIFGIIPFLNIQKKYDIIHCHFGPSGLFAVFLQSLGVLDGRIITTFHGYDVNLNYLNRSVYRELFDKGDKFIAVSKYIASKLLALGCKSEKLIIIPNGVDLDFYTPSKRENSEGVIRILSIGRLVEKKGFIFGLKAIKDLLNLHLNIEYNIIGNGVLFNSFEKFIQDHKLEKHIHLIGALNKDSTLKFYQNSDIFLMPYITADNGDSEGQGLVLQEAQAMELPVISTFHNGVQEGVLNMKTGFLVEEKDINSLLEKLEILILNEKLRKKMGKAGREYVINNFNQKLFNQKLKQEYQRTLKR